MRYLEKLLTRSVGTVLIAAILGLLTAAAAQAAPPHPDLLEKARAAKKATGVSIIPSTRAMHDLGIDTPDDFFLRRTVDKSGRQQTSAATGPWKALALLVDFSDHVRQANATFFNTLIFGNVPGTVWDYFDEVSYAQLDLITVNLPSTVGWARAPQTYAYYVDGQYGMYGDYPHNAQKLVEDLADAVDGAIDFSEYDNDNDGYVDVLIVVHAGTGAELSGNANDIWSHKWGITPRLMNDGVFISNYTIQPEFWVVSGDMTPGVYAHELSHGFGLPDLYDTDSDPEFVSNGIGRWCIMSFGSWNGVRGSSPAHPCAWSRIQMGFASSVNVTSNRTQQAIDAVESGGSIFRLWSAGAASSEYFLVENRQRTGYDTDLPSSGLLIWHIDNAKANNEEEWYPGVPGAQHFLVALEQADGSFQLEHATSMGDASDPFPGSTANTTFGGISTPSSGSYTLGATTVVVDNISASSPTMHADLLVGIAANVDDEEENLPSVFALEQNYPNPFNPATIIKFSTSLADYARLEIFNTLGQHVTTLFDGPVSAGSHSVTWDATDANGRPAASGTYFYKLELEDQEQAKKMLLVR